MLSYQWPGNVRELDNVMQRALILQPGNTITSLDLGLQLGDSFSEKPSLVDSIATETKRQITSMVSDASSAINATATPLEMPKSEVYGDNDCVEATHDAALGADMKKHEFEIIVKTLKQENGSKKNTAEKLGISPRTLRYKLARLRDEGYSLEMV